MRRATLAAKLIGIFFFGSLGIAAHAASSDDASTRFIRRDGALLRAEPRLHAASLSRLGNGEKVLVLDRQGVWSKVRAGKYIGWVPERFLSEAGMMRLPAASPAADFEALQRLESRRVSDDQLDKFRSSARLVPR